VVLAHRGASAYAPEHTFAAYDLAITQDTDFLECDLQLTADEVLVCVHDTTVDRTTGGASTGRVDAFTLAELRAMDFGSWFAPEFAGASIVPFEEQLDCYLALNPSMRFHIETKAPAEYGGRMEPLLIDVLRERDLIPDGAADPQSSTVIVQSFEIASLRAVRALAPSVPTAWLWGVPPPEAATGMLPAEVDVAAPNAAVAIGDPTLTARLHANGHEVHVYTVDDADQMRTLLDLGVDGIFTNRPDVLRGVIDERGAGVPAGARGNPAPGSFAPGCPGVAGSVAGSGVRTPPAPTTTIAPASEPAALPRTGPPAVAPLALAAVLALVIGGALARRR
jgi:glycerophosphoryl diester phosphodiesterase